MLFVEFFVILFIRDRCYPGKKKGAIHMGRIFDMDNKFFRFMSKVADLCILNIICVVCCIPVITAGASITAMYYVTLKMVRNEEAYILRSFFKSFKQNFKQATIINLIMLLIGVVLYVDLNVSKAMPDRSFKLSLWHLC